MIELNLRDGRTVLINANLICGIVVDVDKENKVCGSIIYSGNHVFSVKQFIDQITLMIGNLK